MPRYIDADLLIQKLDGWRETLAETYGLNDEYVKCLNEVLTHIEDANTEDVVPMVHGQWEERVVDSEPVLFWRRFYCSCCGRWTTYGETEYCPHCGAKMEKSKIRACLDGDKVETI